MTDRPTSPEPDPAAGAHVTDDAERYPFAEIEPKWRERWESLGLFRQDLADATDRYYCLNMFPYPSGDLHVGHGRNYILGDAVVRYALLRGKRVLAVMGWDAFGLPAENAAIANHSHPETWTRQNIARMKRQFHAWGIGLDWTREVASCHPGYYRWTQWIFLKLFERGLAYRGKAPVNWCPSCNTVLANEQVVGAGECWRCGTPVVLRELEQWFFRITEYAQRLLDDLEFLPAWPERVRVMQQGWIGRSVGAEVHWPVQGTGEDIVTFTTRLDTIFGATFLVLAPNHSLVAPLLAGRAEETACRAFAARVAQQMSDRRHDVEPEKEGVFTGRFCIHPFTGQTVPIWLANYVVMGYGTGAVQCVPAHDTRDYEFAKKYGLPILPVVRPVAGAADGAVDAGWKLVDGDPVFTGEGECFASDGYDGLGTAKACARMAADLDSRGQGRATVQYRMHDWLVSRQRYWGAPIPIIYCAGCGIVPVPEEDLPVLLPHDVEFKPTGESPLAGNAAFVNAPCPKCGGPGRRETDTLDTFVDSAWYFLRFLTPRDGQRAFDSALVNAWLPVDQYIGGVEHATKHLIYARFLTKVFHDMGLVGFQEPFRALFTQGMITRGGIKMSKSKHNTVAPDALIARYGTDTGRVYTLFIGPPEKDAEWSDLGVEGSFRFLNRAWRLCRAYGPLVRESAARPMPPLASAAARDLRHAAHTALARVTRDFEEFHFNTAVAAMMELVNTLSLATQGEAEAIDSGAAPQTRWAVGEALRLLFFMLAPIAPHVAEELWEAYGDDPAGGSIFRRRWPRPDPAALAAETETVVIQVNGKLRVRLELPTGLTPADVEREARENPRIQELLAGKTLRKVIHVPHRLINLVVS